MSSNGIEIRFPFLDVKLVEISAQIDEDVLTKFTLPKGEGDKQLLRNCALKLGLE